MRLYHFTNWVSYLKIVATAQINVTESNIGSGVVGIEPYGEHVGPDVVWLTDKETPEGQGLEHDAPTRKAFEKASGLPYVVVDKRKVRLTVDLPDGEVTPWQRWARDHGINQRWQRRLEKGRQPWHWYVIERPVAMDEVVESVMDEVLADYVDASGSVLTQPGS